MITREADYAIRTVLYLSENYQKGSVSANEISKKMDIPYRFLRKISRRLVESKLVTSQRGKMGGILLNKPPFKINVFEILEIFDNRAITFNRCCKDVPDCNRSPFCPVHPKLKEIQDCLADKLKKISFEKLME